MVRSIWKGPFIHNSIKTSIKLVKKNVFIKIWTRNSMILPSFIGLNFEVYNGKKFISVVIKKNMIGFKFGEFAITRKTVKLN